MLFLPCMDLTAVYILVTRGYIDIPTCSRPMGSDHITKQKRKERTRRRAGDGRRYSSITATYVSSATDKTTIMDEVPGQGDQVTGSLADRSDHHINDIPCDLCAKSEQVTSASGFCRDCNEFLCSICILYHRKVKSLIAHIILEDDQMPDERPVTVNVEKCSRHPDRPVEMYCTDEGDIGCALCFIEGHRTCQNVALISNILKDVEQSEYIDDIKQISKKHKELYNTFRGVIQKYRMINEQCQARCLESFQTFRAEVEAVLDILGEKISQEAEKLQKENTDKLNNLEEMISSHEQQLEFCMQDIDNRLAHNQQQLDQLFITVKKNKKWIIEKAKQLEQLGDSTNMSDFYVDYDQSIKRSLQNVCTVKIKQPATKCTDVSKVYVKSTEDTEECTIRGILVVAETKLFVTDMDNKCLKLIDMESDKIIQRRSLPSAPWDITELPGTRIAVALPSRKKILFFTADNNMNSCGSITVTGKCRGLHCTGDRLYVVYKNPKAHVQVLNLEGKVIQSIQRDPLGCALPGYLTLDSKNMWIYVKDQDKHIVQSMNASGVIKWRYQNTQLKCPVGVVGGDAGCLYICSRNNNSIHAVSPGGTRLAVISQSESGLCLPEVVFYSSLNRTLYVSCFGDSNRNSISRLRLQ